MKIFLISWLICGLIMSFLSVMDGRRVISNLFQTIGMIIIWPAVLWNLLANLDVMTIKFQGKVIWKGKNARK